MIINHEITIFSGGILTAYYSNIKFRKKILIINKKPARDLHHFIFKIESTVYPAL